MAVVDMPPVVAVNAPATMASSASLAQNQQPLQDGVRAFVSSSAKPTLLLSLQERKIPTAEEIARKKLNFNLLFWGGGFVAPFVATVFYFGFKFWEK
jgi:hypothetical protein